MLFLRSSLAVSVLLLLTVPSPGLAVEEVVLGPEGDEVRLDDHVEFLEDGGQRLTIEQVASPLFDARFRRARGRGSTPA